MKPLEASLALLLAVGTATAATAAGTPANSAAHTSQHPSSRYVLRQQQRNERALRAPISAASHAPGGAGNTLPVTSCTDDPADAGSLRNVLASAAEGDTVDLAALTCSTITLVNGPLDTSVLGEHHLYDVTLQGPGRDALTIEAAGQSQVLVIGGFSSDKGTFTANDLTIANGTYGGSLAACVEGFGGALVLNRVAVTNCHTTGHYALLFGGAVDVTTLVMTDSSITNSTSAATSAGNTAAGGGAYVSDSVTLVRSTISGNGVTAPVASTGDGYYSVGGGLYSRGDLTMTDSTISGNSIDVAADGEGAPGGGIYVRGIADISGSTIDRNVADGDGGGIFKAIFSVYGEPGGTNPQTKLTIRNSTLTGNTAARGGAIASSRPVYLANSTIAGNFADDGAGGVLFNLVGIIDSAGILDAQSTIIAANTGGDGATLALDLAADDTLVVTGSHDLIVDAGAIELPADTIAADPMLGALGDNGGPTQTLALLEGSPAIDAGSNPFDLEFDQRGEGFPRVVGAAADIGAIEFAGADTDVIFADGFDTPQ
ncbi:MAG: choice-of-anchor Q domain-containing protein [Rhodanobacteraceae bacterium]